ncbi:hypothetical protein BSY16_2618 [Sinorhizobium sp. RAC02]|nr:hypothetical protein BSY16_2618 [Sinorhizobium sp. RAC02]
MGGGTPADIVALRAQLLAFPRLFPVNQILYRGEKIWPVFRFALWRTLRAIYEGRDNKVNPQKPMLPPEWEKEYRELCGAISIDELATNSPLDFLFFVNQRGVEQFSGPEGIYNRITDPVFEAARTVGTAQKIELLKSRGLLDTNRVHPPIYILPPQLRSVGHIQLLDVPPNFVEILQASFPAIQFRDDDVSDIVDWHFHQYEIYHQILTRMRPKCVFFMGFEFHLALSQAAADLGIKSVDLQHGTQTGWGPLYKWWDEMPAEGYKMLPDYFCVWGKRDFDHLSTTIPGAKHQPIIGGFPWMDRQKDLGAPLSDAFKAKLAAYKKVILVTLQHQNTVPEILSATIAQSPSDYLWLLRKHPKGRSPKARGALARDNVVISPEVDNVVLSHLLPLVDVHMTAGSTVVLEADYFGVPSIVWDVTGVENYEEMIEEGLVHSVYSSAECVAILATLERRPSTGSEAICVTDTAAVLRSLVKL